MGVYLNDTHSYEYERVGGEEPATRSQTKDKLNIKVWCGTRGAKITKLKSTFLSKIYTL